MGTQSREMRREGCGLLGNDEVMKRIGSVPLSIKLKISHLMPAARGVYKWCDDSESRFCLVQMLYDDMYQERTCWGALTEGVQLNDIAS
nr:hypothetical protein BgiMline_030064 [Biomphalaria glabrata]